MEDFVAGKMGSYCDANGEIRSSAEWERISNIFRSMARRRIADLPVLTEEERERENEVKRNRRNFRRTEDYNKAKEITKNVAKQQMTEADYIRQNVLQNIEAVDFAYAPATRRVLMRPDEPTLGRREIEQPPAPVQPTIPEAAPENATVVDPDILPDADEEDEVDDGWLGWMWRWI